MVGKRNDRQTNDLDLVDLLALVTLVDLVTQVTLMDLVTLVTLVGLVKMVSLVDLMILLVLVDLVDLRGTSGSRSGPPLRANERHFLVVYFSTRNFLVACSRERTPFDESEFRSESSPIGRVSGESLLKF